MKFNSPLPQSLPKECAKASKIFQSFVDSGNNGLDGVIPRHVLENAKGFAIFTIFKAGFLFSARAGSGIVIARLPDGSWSAPSAIGTAGLGVGGQAGAEMTDFLVVLNSRAAIRSFMAAGSLTLGGNASIAVGPLGRNGEASGSLNTSGKVAAMYSYSKTRGLFGGLSIEGSVIVERQDANVQAYGNDQVTAKLLLSGSIDRPPWASSLIKTLESCTGLPGNRQWIEDGGGESGYIFGGLSSPGAGTPRKLKKNDKGFPPTSWGEQKDNGSYFGAHDSDTVSSLNHGPDTSNSRQAAESSWTSKNSFATSGFGTQFDSDFSPQEDFRQRNRRSMSYFNKPAHDPFDSLRSPASATHNKSFSVAVTPSSSTRSFSSSANPFTQSSSSNEFDAWESSSPMQKRFSRADSQPFIAPKPELTKPLLPHEGVARAVALYNFAGVEAGDLAFKKGDVIVVTQRSDSTDDWWTGKVEDRKGIFPANFVEVV